MREKTAGGKKMKKKVWESDCNYGNNNNNNEHFYGA